MNVQNIKRGSRLKHKSLVVVFATVICLLLVSPFVFVIDISGDGIGVNSAKAFNFSGKLDKIAEKAGFDLVADSLNLFSITGKIIYSCLALLGVVFLIIVIIGGYRWMMSDGNEETINRAKQSIKNAIIGVVIVLSAYAITYYVLNELL